MAVPGTELGWSPCPGAQNADIECFCIFYDLLPLEMSASRKVLLCKPSRSFAKLPEAGRKLPRASQSFWRLPETGASRKVPEACRELVGARKL